MMRYVLSGVFALLFAAGGVLLAQRPPAPTFRVQVDAVELDAFVTDAQGNPVTGLTLDDFQVFEDGKPQVITSFSQVDIPFEPRTETLDVKSAVEPDVVSNDHNDGRVYMFLLDEVSAANALRARVFLRGFLDRHFAANDRGAVVFLGHQNVMATQMFTNNPRLLLAAIDRFTGGFAGEDGPAVTDGQGGAAANSLIEGFNSAKDAQARIDALATMDGLESAVKAIAGVGGRRKALLLFSSGLPEPIFRALSYNGGVLTKAEEAAHAAVTAATRGSVTIYPIDPAGLTTGLPDASGGDSPPNSNGNGPLDRRMSLSMLADATGGFSLVNSNSFTTAFDRIVRENSTYYLLGYTSSNGKRDGHHRRLRVRVTRPGLVVRAREGYLAPLKYERLPGPVRLASLSPAVSSSVTNQVSDGTVPIRLFAAPYRREGKNALVAIAAEIDPSALGLTERDGVFKGQVEIGFLANDMRDKVYQGEHYTVDLALRAETYDMARQRQGLRVLSEIQLPPGRYQLRLAAGNPAGKAGNVVYDLTVPDFHKDRLMLSGLALTSASTSGAAMIAPKDPLKGFLPMPPTARREFDAGDTLSVFGEVYQRGELASTAGVEVRVELRGQDGRVVRSEAAESPRVSVELPLDDLDGGRYIVHVEATAKEGTPRSAARDIPIRVR